MLYNNSGKEAIRMAYKEGQYCQPWQEYGQSEPPYFYHGSYYGAPKARYWYDQKEGRYYFELDIPGVDKKDISLDMWGENFCFWTKKDGSEYSACYMFPHYVEPQKAQAWYENGVLRVYAPLKDWDKRTHVEIH
jgi:HSP20 family molecular chaperone IbpA